MADAMDLVQQRVEEERQRHIRAARAKTPGVSRVLCVECEAPIPPARRRAIPGVQLCITCQEIAELYEFRRRQQMLGYVSLAEVPAEQLDGKSERIQHYFNAVYCWARAMLNERYQDYDATASGVKRGEELAESSGDLWRDARWAISRVQDAPHCTVELI